MMVGIGDTAVATTPATTSTTGCAALDTAVANPTFLNGAMVWTCPTLAFQTIGQLMSNPSTAFSSSGLPLTLGLLLPPLAIVGVIIGMTSGGRR
jgi:hypothetical protein